MIKLFISIFLVLIPKLSLVKIHYPIKQIKKPTVYRQVPYIISEDWKIDIVRYICSKQWDCRTAVAIAIAESGLNPNAKSKQLDIGIFQINSYWQRNRIKERNLYNIQDNIDIAYEIYNEQGYNPWYVYKRGIYKKFLNYKLY